MHSHMVADGINELDLAIGVNVVAPEEQLGCAGGMPGLLLVHADGQIGGAQADDVAVLSQIGAVPNRSA